MSLVAWLKPLSTKNFSDLGLNLSNIKLYISVAEADEWDEQEPTPLSTKKRKHGRLLGEKSEDTEQHFKAASEKRNAKKLRKDNMTLRQSTIKQRGTRKSERLRGKDPTAWEKAKKLTKSPEKWEPKTYQLRRGQRHPTKDSNEMVGPGPEADLKCEAALINTLKRTKVLSLEPIPELNSKHTPSSGNVAEPVNDMSETDPGTDEHSSSSSQTQTSDFPYALFDDGHLDDDGILQVGQQSVKEETIRSLQLPSTYQEGFVEARGYWRLAIMVTDHQTPTCINAFFLPLITKGADDPQEAILGSEANSTDPRGCNKPSVFIRALSHGVLPASYSVGELLDIARQELKGRQTVFVLDAFSHGQGEVEVVINRAY